MTETALRFLTHGWGDDLIDVKTLDICSNETGVSDQTYDSSSMRLARWEKSIELDLAVTAVDESGNHPHFLAVLHTKQ